ncbi:helix-turn-helix domain-containing protein [Streptomyces sp. NPDC007063]|uniref:helix-turn-helix domain-containing protein n=1 Tax=Streptomyces sp. NPDC007063 TaxID=3364772 RepID=UPI003699C678
MGSDWVRLGAKLKAARKAAGLTQEEMAEQLGVSRSAIQAIDRGDSKRITTTIRAYAHAVGWDEASAPTILAGGDPIPAEPPSSETKPDATTTADAGVPLSDLPLRVVHSLSEGALLDTDIIDLPTSNSEVRMTVVVRGKPGASPEEIKKAIEAWERAARHVQRLDDDINET